MDWSFGRLTLAAVLAAMVAAPAAAQQRRQAEREVVLVEPSKVDMALAERRELGLTDQQVRRLEEIRADAERRAAAVLNAQQNQQVNQRQQRLRSLREHGPMGMEPECERSEDGRRVECRHVRILGPGMPGHAVGPDTSREFEVCERPSGAAETEEKCRTVRVRGEMGPMGSMMMFGHPGMVPGMMPHMPMMRMHAPPMERERCTTDAQGKESCEVVRFRMRHQGGPRPEMPMDTTGASCERSTDEQGRERLICRRERTRQSGEG